MADIIELRTTKRSAPQDRWTVAHVYGSAGGIEIARCTREGYPGMIYLLGMCTTASDVDVLAEATDTPEGIAILDYVAPAALRAADWRRWTARLVPSASRKGAGHDRRRPRYEPAQHARTSARRCLDTALSPNAAAPLPP